MKKLIFLQNLFLFSLTFGQGYTSLFEIDVRIRVVSDDILYVVVQIDNHTGRTITELEGYITEIDPKNNIVSEQKIIHHHSYEPPLRDGNIVVRGITYPFDRIKDHRYRYHISHLKFKGDQNTYIYSPAGELLRIN